MIGCKKNIHQRPNFMTDFKKNISQRKAAKNLGLSPSSPEYCEKIPGNLSAERPRAETTALGEQMNKAA